MSVTKLSIATVIAIVVLSVTSVLMRQSSTISDDLPLSYFEDKAVSSMSNQELEAYTRALRSSQSSHTQAMMMPTPCSSCPEVDIVSLQGIPNFPQVDELNVCAVADTATLLLKNLGECRVENLFLDVVFDTGLAYGGIVGMTDTDEPETIGEFDVSNGSIPRFLVSGIDSGQTVILYFGMTADCNIDVKSGDKINFDVNIEYGYDGNPADVCTAELTEVGDYNSGIKVPVLNVRSVSPESRAITSSTSAGCQDIVISQDGLRASLDAFTFEIEGFKPSFYSLSSISIGGYNPTYEITEDSIVIVSVEAEAFTDGIFDESESISIRVCYNALACTDEQMFLNYNAFYGCNNEICFGKSSKEGTVSFEPNFGANVQVTEVNMIQSGAICGENIIYDVTFQSANSNELDGLWQDMDVRFEGCLGANMNYERITLNGIDLPADIVSVVGSRIRVELDSLDYDFDGDGGLTDLDGDNRFGDLPGGQSLTFQVEISVACADNGVLNCSPISCSFGGVEVRGLRNCGQRFQQFGSISNAPNILYGTDEQYNDEEVIGTYNSSQPMVHIERTTSGVWTHEDMDFGFHYSMSNENIQPCGNISDVYLEAKLYVYPDVVKNMRYLSGSAIYEGMPVADADVVGEPITQLADDGVSLDTLGYRIRIYAGDTNVDFDEVYDYEWNVEYRGYCGLDSYYDWTVSVIEICEDCTPSCTIRRACDTQRTYVDWRGSNCQCDIRGSIDTMYRLTYGYQDKDMTIPVNPDDIPDIDKRRFIPGDSVYVRQEFEVIDKTPFYEENIRSLTFYMSQYNLHSPARMDPTQTQFLNWYFYDASEDTTTPIGFPSYLQQESSDFYFPGIVLRHYGVEDNGNNSVSGNQICTDDPDIVNPEFDPNTNDRVKYWQSGISSSDVFDWQKYMYVYFADPEECNSDRANDSYQQFLNQFPVDDGDKFYVDFKAVFVQNPGYKLGQLNGLNDRENNVIYPYLTVGAMSKACTSYNVSNSCTTGFEFETHVPGPVEIVQNIEVDDCDVTVDYDFTLTNTVPEVQAGGTPWYQNEYRPYMATEYLQLNFPSNMVYGGDGVIKMPDGSTIPIPQNYIDEDYGNLTDVLAPNATDRCYFAEDSDQPAGLRVNDADFYKGLDIPYAYGPEGNTNETRHECDNQPLIHTAGDPFPMFSVGGSESCTYGIQYPLRSICPENVEIADFSLDYQFADNVVPNLASREGPFAASGINQAGTDLYNPGNNTRNLWPINPYGYDCNNQQGGVANDLGCVWYYGNVVPHPEDSPGSINPSRQTGSLSGSLSGTSDLSSDFPPLTGTVNRLLLSDLANQNEMVEYELCAGDASAGSATHMNIVTAIAVPNAVDFIQATNIDGDVLDVTLSGTTSDTKTYAVSSDNLAPGECQTIVIYTELLFCPIGLDLDTEVCVASTSGCLDPAKAAVVLADGGGSCVMDETCYQYIAEEAEIQVEWAPDAVGPYELCTVIPMGTRVKNVKPATLVDITTDWWIPAGLTPVSGSWEVCYPGGPNFTGPCLAIPDPTRDPSRDNIYGSNYSYPDQATWDALIGNVIATEGLKGVASMQDSNFIQFRFELESICDDFVSGTSPWFRAGAADPCEATISSNYTQATPIIIDGANPADFAQFYAFAEPMQAHCGTESILDLTFLNVSPLGESRESYMCIDFETATFDYQPGSAAWVSPAGWNAMLTETTDGPVTTVCMTIPDGIGPGEAFKVNFTFDIPEDIACGDASLNVAVQSTIMDIQCQETGEACDVQVLNSINPQVDIEFLPPLPINNHAVYMECQNADGTIPLCYEVEVGNVGDPYANDVIVEMYRDINLNGMVDDFESSYLIGTQTHEVNLVAGQTQILESCFNVLPAEACPIVLRIEQTSNCVCNTLELPIDEVRPSLMKDGPRKNLCPGDPLVIDNCGQIEYSVTPSNGATLTEVGDNLQIDLNDGYGIDSPVTLVLESTVGSCDPIREEIDLYNLAGFEPGPYEDIQACNVGCKRLTLAIPVQYQQAVSVQWSPGTYLDDPTSKTPIICDPQEDITYEITFSFEEGGNVCSVSALYPITVIEQETNQLFEQVSLCTDESATLTAPEGYNNYNWFQLADDGSSVVVQAGSSNTYQATEEGRYYLEYVDFGDICKSLSNVFEVVSCPEFDKELASITPTTNANEYTVKYNISVHNTSLQFATTYDLFDLPQFEDDIAIVSGNYMYESEAAVTLDVTMIPADPGYQIANDVEITAFDTHNYMVSYVVQLNLESDDTVGDNVYTACGTGGISGSGAPNEGLYNKATLDLNNDTSSPEAEDDDCGDLPYLSMEKALVSVTETSANCYDVVYRITVENSGGAEGQYDLVDDPDFDDDFTINSADEENDAVGNPDGALPEGDSYVLADDQPIAAGKTDTYLITINACIDLTDGGAIGGDDMYTACGTTNGFSDPTSGEGLYNNASLDSNNDGNADITDEVCADVPYFVVNKTASMAISLADGSYDIEYTIVVTNQGASDGEYSLYDYPQPDDDVVVNSSSYSFEGGADVTLAYPPSAPGWLIGDEVFLDSGESHTYTVMMNVILDVTDGEGDDIYTECGTNGTGSGVPGEGTYNQANLDVNNDGTPDQSDDTCQDINQMLMLKELESVSDQNTDGSYDVVYTISVTNFGSTGDYDLHDLPQFDDDIVINSASFTGPNGAGGDLSTTPTVGSDWLLADDVMLENETTHTYTVTVNVTQTISSDSPTGDGTYMACGDASGGTPMPSQGLYNAATLTNNDSGGTQSDDACGDLPALTLEKVLVSTTITSPNCYDVVYRILVRNEGGAAGQYDLVDDPEFDDDFTITGAIYTSTAVGNQGGSLPIGTDTYVLADDQAISPGMLDEYTMTVSVCLDLEDGATAGEDDDIYTECGEGSDPSGSPDEGLYNQANLDTNNDNTADLTDHVCGDVPYLKLTKENVSVGMPNADGMVTVTYAITVENLGGADATYDLIDTPSYDDDFVIESATVANDAGLTNPALPTPVPTDGWVIQNDQTIAAGDTHVFTITTNVTFSLADGVVGDDTYTECGSGGNTDGAPGEGGYNMATLVIENNTDHTLEDDVCVDFMFYDLALIKQIIEPSPTAYGDQVSYSITVVNQGTMPVESFEITDYLPCGLEYLTNNAFNGWTYNADDRIATTTVNQTLDPGEDYEALIVLQVQQCDANEAADFTNYAEISAFDDDGDPDNTPPMDIDSTPDTDNTNDDGGEPNTNTDDIVDSSNGDEDDHDPAAIDVFDLSLIKMITSNEPYNYGDDIEFTITVCNQGNVTANAIEVSDYTPVGFEYVELDAASADWSEVTAGSPVWLYANDLVPNACVDIVYTMTFVQTSGGVGNYINYAEITSADDDDDPSTDAPEDFDSTPGSDTDSENEILPDGEGDDDPNTNEPDGNQDDHDPAGIQVFDLAQNKVVVTDGPFTYGDQVEFAIEVFNQGSVDASDIVIADFIPCGFSYLTSNDADGWTLTDTVATQTIPALAAGSSTTLNITLEVQQCIDNDQGSFTNVTEITSAVDDTTGEQGDDIDSQMDDDITNDGDVTDNAVDNTNDDEDDHDPASIPIFDLAQIKTLVTDGPYSYGQELEFTVQVCNQGNLPAFNVEITDYIPAGYVFDEASNADWTLSGDEATYTIASLSSDQCVDIPLFMTVQQTAGGSSDWINYTEITSADDDMDDTNTPPVDVDSTPASDGDGENNVQPGDDADDDLTSTDKGGEEDDHDPAGISIYDLAQRKILVTEGPYSYGQELEYAIEVINQGSVTALDVEISDILPCGLEYASANDANGWTLTGSQATYTLASIEPGNTETITMLAVLQSCENSDASSFTNTAEISGGINEETGDPGQDIDSDPDDNPNNDGDPDNDVVDEDGTNGGDEDDHDPEIVEIFDLALMKTLADGQTTPVTVGDDVTMTITVFNQGSVDAANIEVSEYIPAGLELSANDTNGWTDADGNGVYETTIAGPLANGESTTLDVVLTVLESTSQDDYINVAEISYAEDTDGVDRSQDDIDSVADGNEGDDTGGEVNSPDDNNINEDGRAGDDEDDHDPAIVPVEYADLALIKTLADGQSQTVVAGDMVNFDITVYNQGSVSAYNIAVIDYVPAGLIYDDSFGDNAATGWTDVDADGNPELTIAGPLAAYTGEEVVTVTLQLDPTFEGTADITNVAEITGSEDENGDPQTDIDSTPDTVPDNETGTNDDETNDPNDEDDSDPAVIRATAEPVYDLALLKTLADDTELPVFDGDTVTFDVTVINQGTETVYDVEITDNMGQCLDYSKDDTNGWTDSDNDGAYENLIPGPLAAGESVTIPMEVVIVCTPTTAEDVTNIAEISAADDEDGNPVDDIDSTPDMDPDNDGDPMNDQTEDPDDEDDHDPEVVPVSTFDIALIKRIDPAQEMPIMPGDDVRFFIDVINQGTADAHNVTVLEHSPEGLTLSTADNNGWTDVDGDGTYQNVIDEVVANTTQTVAIVMTIDPDAADMLRNQAEVASVEDENGDEVDDIDSTPDSDPDNDPMGDNDQEDGDGTDDEDDHDWEDIMLGSWDLALTKQLADGQSAYVQPGDDVDFVIEVINQGNMAAANIAIAEYVPQGFTLSTADANGWTDADSDGVLENTITGPVAPDATATINITLTVAADFAGTSLTNVAEIASFEDENGNAVPDNDSTPDSDPDNDVLGDDNQVDGDGTDDEDDHDPEVVYISSDPVYDLALTKTLDPASASPIYPGADVTFIIEVTNQGNTTVQNVEVVDYLPTELTLSAADTNGWTDNNGDGYPENTIAGPLAAGEIAQIAITVTIADDFTGGELENRAEISRFEDEDGDPKSDEDSTPDNNPGDPEDEDDEDGDVIEVEVFDLALEKVLAPGQTGPYAPGMDVTFQIRIHNQGTVAAANVVIDEYLPAELTLSAADTNGWSDIDSDGNLENTIAGPIAPDAYEFVNITVTIADDFTGDSLENRAEISDAEDEDGNHPMDTDSTPDGTPGDPEDEDDEDGEEIPVFDAMFDLALRKVLSPEFDGYAQVGEDIPFDIWVYNQGNVTATNIELTEMYPDNFSLSTNDTNGWADTDNDGIYETTVLGPLAPGESVKVEIILTMDSYNHDGADAINVAEISGADDENGDPIDDIDSTPDMDPTNDTGGDPYGDTDDETEDDGTIDEDDHDPELIPIFDLAIRKTLAQETPIRVGDVLTYTIEVFNQGNVDAYNVEVIDNIPAGLALSADDTNGWTEDTNGNAVVTIDEIARGESVVIEVDMVVVAGANADNVTNTVEITDADDVDGNTPEDVDSTPDENPEGDDLLDDEITNPDDEDDHDVAVPHVYDLALIKIVHQDEAVTRGDTVLYDIIVVNQGNMTATQMVMIDALPEGLLFPADINPAWVEDQGNLYAEMNVTLQPSEREVVPLWLIVSDDAAPENVINYAEIMLSSDEDGNDMTDYDIDSTPDNDVTNDVGNDPFGPSDNFLLGNSAFEVNGVMDEDDSDPARLQLLLCHDMSCHGLLNVSLDENCEASITAHMMLTNPQMGEANYAVEITDQYGQVVDNSFDASDIGKTFNVSVSIPTCADYSCWGEIFIEDKFAPVIDCEDVTVACHALSTVKEPTATDNCSDYEVVLVGETIHPEDCATGTAGSIVRMYQAIDAAGNESPICTQTITLTRPDITLVEFPTEITLECSSGYAIDGEGHPAPSASGTATYDGEEIFPNQLPDELCNIYLTYQDVEIPTGDCGQKIMRAWTIREWWCGGETTNGMMQVINIVDTQGPVLTCGDDITVSTNDDCEGVVTLPAIQAVDACSGIESYLINTGHEVIRTNGGVATFPGQGTYDVTYTVYDDCYNSSECTINVTVEDRTEPIALCDEFTIVGIGNSGLHKLYAESIDDGSFDECGDVELAVRRMTDACGQSGNTTFGEYVEFCCADAGTEVMVALLVTDASGNTNQCMVTVEVQDKLTPTMTCPADETITCATTYDLENLSAQFGMPDVVDNCGGSEIIEQVTPDIDQCGLGTIVRNFTIVENEVVVASCIQRITVINDDPFDFATDIIWPVDVEMDDLCSLDQYHPDNLPVNQSYPRFTEDQCDLVAARFEDEVFTFAQGEDGVACAKILRTWKVIDWCQTNTDGTVASETHVQVLKLNNTVAPTIASCDVVTATSFDPDCGDVAVSVTAPTATDDCSGELQWSYAIDLDKDGDIDIEANGADASRDYTVGTHEITWTVRDLCGNTATCSHDIVVTNEKTPVPVCINGLSGDLVPMDLDNDGVTETGMLEVWATDFDGGSYHPCGYGLTYSFSSDVSDNVIMFDCTNIGRNTIDLWVTDENGNQSFCSTYIDISDNSGVCPPMPRVSVGGHIATDEGVDVPHVEVSLMGSDEMDVTEMEGEYDFADMPTGGNYQLNPYSNHQPRNGVSTIDIILIQRHILEIQELQNVYDVIAADANNSGSISSADVVDIRRLILEITDEFANNTSWRFVDSDQAFIDHLDPWAEGIAESYDIFGLNSNMLVDFVGVKVGDVNGSVAFDSTEFRSGALTTFAYEQIDGTIVVTSTEAMDFAGLQLALDVAGKDAIVTSELVDFDASMYVHEDGELRISYSNPEVITVPAGMPLFTIETDAKTIDVATKSRLTSEVYEGFDLRKSRIVLEHIEESQSIAMSNYPNPWREYTTINIESSVPTNGLLSFYSTDGKLLNMKSVKLATGTTEVIVNKSEIEQSGVVVYQLEIDGEVYEERMLIID